MSRAHPRRRRPRLAAFALAGVAGSLAVTSPAWAAPGIDPGSGAYWNTDPTYQITGGAAENLTWAATGPGGFATGGTLVGGGPVSLAGFPEGGGTLTAFPTENPADAASVAFTKDVTPPAVSLALTGTASPSGWYRSPLTITPTCTDLAPIVAGCTAIPWTTDGANRTATPTATDAAGNVGTNSVTFNYDNTLPLASDGLPSQPAPAALVAAEPQFSWTPGVDAVSGVDRYQLQFRNVTEGTGYETIAVVNHTGGVGDYSARRDPALRAAPLPQQDQLQWRVVTIDKAGNARDSAPRGLTIDSSIPPAPVITGGPSTPIRFTSPTFSWTGTQETYLWDLTIPGREAPVRSGGGLAKEVTLQSLADGPYTFRVSQVTPFGQPSAQATRAFVVDTTPPAAPEITVRPPFPASCIITFGWSVEPGAFSRWQIVGAGGAAVIGPSDTPLNSVSIANLADGAYSFQVLQVDSAGNASASTSEPFTVTTPLAPGQSPSTSPRVQPEFLLPTQNAFRLRPKAGKTLPTRRPVLKWRKGPRGTRLYNVQIFKVVKKRHGAAPTVKKVYSGFPRKRQLRAPKSKMQPGTCYVWRVWPYTGTRFTPKPLGISNFCVAKASVLKKKAAQAAARKAARRAR
jgi:hypothetical protein